MNKNPDNSVLLEKLNSMHTLQEEKFKNIKNDLKGINKRLDTLNSQTSKNTASRERQKVINAIIGTIGTFCLSGIIALLLRIFV